MQGFIVYLLLYSVLLLFAKIISIQNGSIWKSGFTYLSIIFFGVITGLRWNVGTDYPNYYDLVIGDLEWYYYERLEYAPRYLMFFIQDFHFHFSIWFIIMSVIQYTLFLVPFRGAIKKYLPIAVFFYLAIYLDTTLNIMRQGVALSAVFAATSFIQERRWKGFLIFMILAFCFHRSSVLFLPAYFANKDFKFKPVAIYGIVVIAAFMGYYLIQKFFDNFSNILAIINLDKVSERFGTDEYQIKNNLGLGIAFTYLKYFVLIYYNKKINDEETKKWFPIWNNLFLFGVIAYSVTMSDMYLSRMMLYFQIADVIVSSCVFTHMLHNKKHCNLARILIIGQAVIVIYSVTTGEPWHFIDF